jgi:MFS transporter, DHA1 family, solute carrier family 18 (vesicular amine transporter), member 1/2
LARFRPWIIVGVVTFALFLDYLLYGIAVPLTPHAPAQLKQAHLGLLYGAYAISVLAVTPVFGYFGDRIGTRPTLFWGVILGGISCLLFALGSGLLVLSLAKLCQGAASAASWTAGLALIAENYTEKRVEMIGYAFAGSTAGSVLGPVLGGMLHRAAGYSLPFLAAGLLFLVEAGLLLLLPKGRGGRGEPVRWRALLLNPSVLAQAGFVAVAAFAWGIIEPLLPYHLETLGAGAEVVGVLFTVSSIIYGLSAPWVGWLSERLAIRTVILVGILSMALLLPMLSVPGQVLLIGGVLCLVNISYAFILNPASAELGNAVDRIGMSCYSAVYALYNIAYSLGMIATTALATATGSFLTFRGMLLSVSSILVLCGLLTVSVQLLQRPVVETSAA